MMQTCVWTENDIHVYGSSLVKLKKVESKGLYKDRSPAEDVAEYHEDSTRVTKRLKSHF